MTRHKVNSGYGRGCVCVCAHVCVHACVKLEVLHPFGGRLVGVVPRAGRVQDCRRGIARQPRPQVWGDWDLYRKAPVSGQAQQGA